ncbi:hypothetical protein KO465_04685 [Candidatus Micrarchaeota archaeon]|nr:hypothetical protein [Candidatus Micrarchaeota archaeon]
MITTMEEMKKFEGSSGQIINGVDNPNLLSVDSTEVYQAPIDMLDDEENTEKKAEETHKKPDESKEAKPGDDEETLSDDATESDEKKKAKPKDEGKVPASVQKRINQAIKAQRNAERERDYERSLRANETTRLKEEIKKLKAQIPAAPEPKRDSFEDDDEYIEAITKWRVDERLKEMANEIEKEDANEQTYTGNEPIEKLLAYGEGTYEDFETVVCSEDLNISQGVADIVLDLDQDVAVEILYYLGKNPPEAKRISNLNSLQIAREIGKLEAALAKEIDDKSTDTEDTTDASKAVETKPKPAPIKPVRVTQESNAKPESMSFEEYRKWRTKK